MKVKRNTDGLRQNAQAKRKEAFEKVERGIQQLIKEKRPVNFNQVSEASGVSKAWLYKEPEIKARIEHLRAQSKPGVKLTRKISASEASTKALNMTLQKRIKKLESENRELRKQNEIAYGQVIQVKALKKQVNQLRAENDELKNRKDVLTSQSSESNTAELKELGVQMNSTLESLFAATPQGVTQAAIEALREAMKHGSIKSPGGFLNVAIRDTWKPNQHLQENSELEKFNKWWPTARKKGLVVASQQVDGVVYVYTSNGEQLPFSEAFQIYKL